MFEAGKWWGRQGGNCKAIPALAVVSAEIRRISALQYSHMELFLESFLYPAYATILGLIIGSFLNVFLYRFHTGKSLNGSSHCLSCRVRLYWYELVPLVSYIVLLGRCRTCSSYIPSRYFLVEILTGLAFWLAATSPFPILLQAIIAIFFSVLILILIYDLAHTIIPDEFVLALVGLAFLQISYQVYFGGTIWDFGFALLSGLAAAGPFVFLWVISQGRWIGLGDAKLAFPLGMMVGLYGVVSLVILSFWLGAAISLILIGIQKLLKRGQIDLRITGRALTMKSEIPFAPFLILAFLAVFLLHIDAVSLLSYVI